MQKEEVIEFVENCMAQIMKNIDEKFEELCKDLSDHNSTKSEKFENKNNSESEKLNQEEKPGSNVCNNATEIFAESLKLLTNEMKKGVKTYEKFTIRRH